MLNLFKCFMAMAAVLLVTPALPAGVHAAEQTKVRISAQPIIHGMPSWYAKTAGWDKNTPISLDFALFPSGAPQVEALGAGAWDIGATGAVPAIMAGLRYEAVIIAVPNDESETTDMWVRPDSPLLKVKGAIPGHPDIYGSPNDWKGKKILATTLSTGHYVVGGTLKLMGLTEKDISLVHIEQGQAITAFGAGQGDILQLWSPFGYIAESRGWVKVASAKRAGLVIPDVVLVRKEFAEQHPDLVVEWLGMFMRGLDMARTDKDKTIPVLTDYFKFCGLKLPDFAVTSEVSQRPLFSLAEQTAMLTDPAKLKTWLGDIGQFFTEQKRFTQKELDAYLEANCHINAKFLKMLADKQAANK